MNGMQLSKLFNIEGMVVVITGGGTGIGLMMTQAFAQNGAAKVYIVGRRKDKLEEAAKKFPNVIPVVGDVTSKQSLMQVAQHIKQETGYINLLCCNSGYMPPAMKAISTDASIQEFAKDALEQKFEDWTTTFTTNSTSLAFCTFAFLELLDAGNRQNNCPNRRSQIIVTTSIAGYLRIPSIFGAYGASKAAATHLVKHLAGVLVPYHIRVNGIAPGLFPSELAAGLIAKGDRTKGKSPTDDGAFDTDFIPATRLGKAEDIAGAMLYMASDAGSYMNGNIQVVDGGRMGLLPSTY